MNIAAPREDFGTGQSCRPLPDRTPSTDALRAILAERPFAALTRLAGAEWINPPSRNLVAEYAIAVPVRNEAELLPRALSALERTMRSHRGVGALVFAVNDTTDGSAALIATWARETALPCILIEVEFDEAIRNAPHGRRLALDVASAIAPSGELLTTDADSHVGPDWVEKCRARLAGGHAMVCEDVRLDEEELTRLPDRVRHMGDIERQYYSALSQLWERWTGGMGGTFAYRASGASLAIRTAIYEAVGRLPLPPHGEDAALCARVVERGYEVAQVSDLGTRTSARLDGRAAGGCGQALQHRSVAADPFCDAALVSIPVLRKRAATGTNRDDGNGAAPLRLSEVERELAIARRLLLEGEREVA